MLTKVASLAVVGPLVEALVVQELLAAEQVALEPVEPLHRGRNRSDDREEGPESPSSLRL